MVLLLILGSVAQADETPVGLADLSGYRAALATSPDASAPIVRFRDLWDRPAEYAGRPVRIAGRLARLFRQPKLGEFPPLVEAWVVSAAGDPFCVVFPDEPGENSLVLGRSVEFSGTFLRQIKYQAGDTARVVPLIVGPRPPLSVSGRKENDDRAIELAGWMIEWGMGLGILAVVGFLLIKHHFSRQVAPPRSFEPDPIFIDGDPEAEGDSNEETD